MEQILTPVMRYTRVYSCAYADLPTVGIRAESLGYATDRLTLYRWNGAAWVALTIYSASGVIADIPTAADLPNGSLYYATDTALLYQVQAAAWVAITVAVPPPPEVCGWELLDSEVVVSGGTTYTLNFAAHDLIKVEYQIIFTAVAAGVLRLYLNGVVAGNNYSTRRIDGAAVANLAARNSAEFLDFLGSCSVVGEILLTGRYGTAGIASQKAFTHRGTPVRYDDMMVLNGELNDDDFDLTSITIAVSAGTMDSGGFEVYGKNV